MFFHCIILDCVCQMFWPKQNDIWLKSKTNHCCQRRCRVIRWYSPLHLKLLSCQPSLGHILHVTNKGQTKKPDLKSTKRRQSARSKVKQKHNKDTTGFSFENPRYKGVSSGIGNFSQMADPPSNFGQCPNINVFCLDVFPHILHHIFYILHVTNKGHVLLKL